MDEQTEPTAPADQGRFVQLLTGSQSRLYAYIMTLVGRSADADDVLQTTNAVLWSKADEYDAARPFLAWAYRFAHLQVLAHRKRASRDRLLFDDELLGRIAEEYARQDEGAERQLEALALCLKGLRPEHRRLVELRYGGEESVNSLAAQVGMEVNTFSAAIYRVRRMLADCISRRLAAGELG
jgi:RNA polymerase sigma-70 factor (ECF subfamily)